MSNLSTLPKGDSAWLLRKAIERIMEQVSVLETNIGASTSGNSANTQIIFNDNGTLRGDAGLVYNKTTDALTVAGLVTAGSATITGDLTVDTSTLKVDSTNNRVGIATASPAEKLTIDNTLGAGAIGLRVFANDQTTARMGVHNTNGQSWQFVAGYAGANNQGLSIFDATTSANRLYLDTSGNANIINGNLILGTSGKGIDFSATASGSGTMTSELLADYEEGTFTPIISGATTAGAGTYTYQVGRYTKVGRTVNFQLRVAWTAHTGTGNMIVDGLPFTSSSVTNSQSSVAIGFFNNVALTASNVATAFVDAGQTSIALYQYPVGGGAAGQVGIDSSADIMLSGSYTV